MKKTKQQLLCLQVITLEILLVRTNQAQYQLLFITHFFEHTIPTPLFISPVTNVHCIVAAYLSVYQNCYRTPPIRGSLNKCCTSQEIMMSKLDE